MSCDLVFFNEPAQGNYQAMGNDRLSLSINLWTTAAHTTPYDLSGYTARGSLRNVNTGAVIAMTSAAITQTSLVCNVLGLTSKATIETLTIGDPYIFDLSVDNAGTGDSKTIWLGNISFIQGASS